MNPHIDKIIENGDTLTFTLSGVNVSLANALRRTILSDIPVVVFKTSPYEENKANILVNTSRLNNEIIKQRLSCIPIHIKDLDMPLENYQLEVDVENDKDTTIFVTTQDFKIKNLVKGDYLTEKDTRAIFPAHDQTGYFIDFVRLRPRISEVIPGEKLHLTCAFSIDNAKTDGMFNVVSSCAYGFTQDREKVEDELQKKMQQWRDQGLNKEEVEFEASNWKALDAQRIVKKDSFDFIVQSIGVFTNKELVEKACDILLKKLDLLKTNVDSDELQIEPSESTMEHSYDIVIEHEDYTIGKTIEYILYAKYFEELKTLSYCGFKKLHPHDNKSLIRIAFHEHADKAIIKQNIGQSVEIATQVFQRVKASI